MKRPTLAVILYLSLVFLSGVLVGGIAMRSVSAKSTAPNREELLRRYQEEMRTRLKLRPDQVQQLSGILEATHERFRELREKYRPEVRAIQDDQVQKIRSMLDQKQQIEYDKMRAEREEQEKHRQPPRKSGC